MNRLHPVSQTVAVQMLDIAVQLMNNYYSCMKANPLSWLRCKVKVAIAVKITIQPSFVLQSGCVCS